LINNTIITEADNLCLLCKNSPTLLCAGIRPYQLRNSNGITYRKCHRLLEVESQSKSQTSLELTGLPEKVRVNFDKYNTLDIKIVGTKVIINGKHKPSILVINTDDNKELPYTFIASLHRNNFQAKYVYGRVFFRWLDYYKLHIDDILNSSVKFVWIDYPELASCPMFIREKFYTAIETRITIGLPTYIRISDNYVVESENDKKFIAMLTMYTK
jgi:hypothetical protein